MPDIQIVHIYGSSYVCSGKNAVGVYIHKPSQIAILIDSGSDAETARIIDRKLADQGYRIRAIIHTHGHANSCGGDRYLKSKHPDLEIYSTLRTAPFVGHPSLELLYFGGSVIRRHQEEEDIIVTDIIHDPDGSLIVDGIEFKVVDLPGHFPGMVGIISPDHVLYCGDALFGDKTLNKQRLLLYMDIAAARRSFHKLENMKPKAYVLYHGGVYHEISDLIDKHLDRMDNFLLFLENYVHPEPATLEELVNQTMEHFLLENDVTQYTLANMIVRAYLAELLDSHRLTAHVQDGTLLFSKGFSDPSGTFDQARAVSRSSGLPP